MRCGRGSQSFDFELEGFWYRDSTVSWLRPPTTFPPPLGRPLFENASDCFWQPACERGSAELPLHVRSLHEMTAMIGELLNWGVREATVGTAESGLLVIHCRARRKLQVIHRVARSHRDFGQREAADPHAAAA